jgi:hypothetical protein
MAIVFNCEHCGKQIKAPDEAAGKRGACPGCKKPCLVPLPTPPQEDDGELRLAPLDDDDERRRKIEEEDRRIRESIMEQRQEPDDPNERFKKKLPKDRQ